MGDRDIMDELYFKERGLFVVPVGRPCRICNAQGNPKFDGYCSLHWWNLQSWIARTR